MKRRKKKIDYSFIIPIRNHSELISSELLDFYTFLKKAGRFSFEILLIGSGSQNIVWQEAKVLTKKIPKLRCLRIVESSYGSAIRHGFLSSLGKSVILLDANFLDTKFVSYCLKQPDSAKNKTVATSENGRSKMFWRSTSFLTAIQNCSTRHELFERELLFRLSQLGIRIIGQPKTGAPAGYYWFGKFFWLYIQDIWRFITFHLFPRKKYQHTLDIAGDDFGISPIVNQAILDQFQAGNIDQISILANLVTDKDLKVLSDLKTCDFALHFNVLRGKPISHPRSVQTLVNKGGGFYSLPVFLWKMFFGTINVSEVEKELKKQLLRLQKYQIPIKLLDSEQHLHVFPPIDRIILRFAEFHQLKIRHQNATEQYLQPFLIKHLVYTLLMKAFTMRYSQTKAKDEKKRYYETYISHPGSRYD